MQFLKNICDGDFFYEIEMTEEVYSKTLKNSSLEVVDERIIHFQFYHVATEPTVQYGPVAQ